MDHSTIAPNLAREIYTEASRREASFLDAPVSGGPAGAENAELTIMAGGNAEAFTKIRPLLEALGSNVRHVGEIGAGSIAKLVNQLLTFLNANAAAEAMLLASSTGVSPADLKPILKTAWGQSAMLERAIDKYAERDFDAGAPLRLFEKDLSLIQRDGRRNQSLSSACGSSLFQTSEGGFLGTERTGPCSYTEALRTGEWSSCGGLTHHGNTEPLRPHASMGASC